MDIDWWLIIVAVWAAIGVVTALVMGRRGFSPWAWLFIGVVIGPLVVPLAVASVREGRPVMLERLSEGRPGGGGTHVLIGIDGSDAARGALGAALSVVGDVLGRCTLAAVIDRDTARAPVALREERQRLQEAIDAAGAAVATKALLGSTAEALARGADIPVLIV